MVMPGNDRGCWWGYLAGKYPGRIGSLVSPGWWKTPVPFAPYALDNGAFKGFQAERFIKLCEKAKRHQPPLWVAVPDCVADRDETLRLWDEWARRVADYRWPLAFVVQDGMTPEDVPAQADVVFVGGSDRWKFRNLHLWTENFKRVHVGRVNTERHLWQAQDSGAESCDGTGWFRDVHEELPKLIRFLDGMQNPTPTFPQFENHYTTELLPK